MHITNIKLWNFRRFGSDGEIDLDKPCLNLNLSKGLNVIIGENDSGKTAIIDAIKLVLKTHSYDYIKVDDKDFYKNASRFRIEIIFSDLLPDEAKNFTEWLGWEGTGAEATPYLKINYDVRKYEGKITPADVKGGPDSDGYQLTAEAREYLKTTYLKPLRDAESELIAKRNSRLSQILIGDTAFKGKEKDHELVKIFGGLSSELKKYFDGTFEVKTVDEHGVEKIARPQDGKEIKDKIDGYIKSFYGQQSGVEFEVISNDLKGILEKLTLLLLNEPAPGLGTLNRLFIAAELLHLNKSNWSGIRLGLIEEIEAHLHPQAQMQVIEALQKQDAIQLILTTHSPNLASKISLANVILCNNGNVFPMGSTYTKLKGDQYKFLEKFLDTTKANLFFAKGVILVEGWAEELLLPSIARRIGINLTEKGVSVVNIGSTAFDHYSKIFLRKTDPEMTIPVSVITDCDIREYERQKNADNEFVYSKRDGATVQSETTEKVGKLSQNSEKNVKYFIAPRWTLEYCLYHSASLSPSFQTTVRAVHTGTDWDADFEKSLAEKLINRGLNKTEIAYTMSDIIDQDQNIIIKADDSTIEYLIKAIQYASGN
jgi:putative ATP-dependent endonuclease of OLD family